MVLTGQTLEEDGSLPDRKEGREIVEKVTVSKVRAHGGFGDTVRRSMH